MKTDEADWRRLWCAYLRFYETELGEEVYGATFARLMSDDPHEFHGLIAELEGRIGRLSPFIKYGRT